MNASIRTTPRFSFHQGAACAAALGLVLTLGACGKKADEATSANATTPAVAGAAKPKTTLKVADLQSAYKSEIDNASTDPLAKKVAAFVAKVGPPASDTGRTKVWYALDADNCSKVSIDGTDGSITTASTDKTDCGLT